MPTRHETRSALRNRTTNKAIAAALIADKRWELNTLDPAEDDKVYEPDWEVSDLDLEAYAEIARDE